MRVLDTNVLSELIRPRPDPAVVAWVRKQPTSSLYTTTITQAEMLYGVAVMPAGRRRDDLRTAVRDLFEVDLSGRVIPFDGDAAVIYAEIAAHRRSLGRPISQLDGLIASIARSRGSAVATRNETDFADCGLDVVNPWSD
ncbi:MAG: type II toxin-antitoxin system VapC family toxin [Deltaproteobacteria bacterium]|nr:MAG: type II toxin-antitoxin system VapC family toxin [Deltaproteobacteria bacterium]